MLTPYRPRGPSDPKKYDIGVLAFREEGHRDSVLMAYVMTTPAREYLTDRIFIRTNAERTLERLHPVRLAGAHALVLRSPVGAGVSGFRDIVNITRQFNTDMGMPYAWRIARYDSYTQINAIEAGRSPDNFGSNLRDAIRRSIADLCDGSFKEQGVTYARP